MAKYLFTIQNGKRRLMDRSFADAFDACLFGRSLLPEPQGSSVHIDELRKSATLPVGDWQMAEPSRPRWNPL
jgi:hypothetical protein